MATITYTVTGTLCSPNQGHATLSVTGGITGSKSFNSSELKGGVSDQDVAEALLILMRRHLEPFTVPQIKANISHSFIVTTENT